MPLFLTCQTAAVAAARTAAALLLLTTCAAADASESTPWLTELLGAYQQVLPWPAVGASITVNGSTSTAVAGRRRAGAADKAEPSDRFHIGSIAKPFTATLLARYVEQGFFGWRQRLDKMFPAWAERMRPAYRAVTLNQLLTHRSGMPYQPRTPETETDQRGPSAADKRSGYVLAAIADPPAAPPGTRLIYGGGHIIAAAYLEALMGEPYETLMQNEVFRPLGLNSARFGPLSTKNRPGLWSHTLEGRAITPVAPADRDFIQARSPAGRNLCLSIGDLGRFASAHLKGARSGHPLLREETWAALHSQPKGAEYARGWGLTSTPWASGRVLSHSGSNLRNWAVCYVAVDDNIAVCLATNIWYEHIDRDGGKVVSEMVRIARRLSKPAGP